MENNFREAESTKAGLRNVQHIIEIWKEKKTRLIMITIT